VQIKAKQHLHAIWMAETREAAQAAFDHFIDAYGAKYDKAVACLVKDRETLLAFYDFPPSIGSTCGPRMRSTSVLWRRVL
jgi:transposase-like protein